ncbi:hypothetical protein Hamer_G015379 [Homarus americanus]|uniref:Uncharacterized protein n=1 Tax=Homarus americanus TaxID=6706 RepID=A0A8J5TJC5_HOMAM|nr:hypothetical protein Hamer_G015379 [Homarus americanus]
MIGSGSWQGEVCTLLYHTSCLTCTAVPGFSSPISGWQVIHKTTKGSSNVVLNTGVQCCPRLCLLATALDFPVLACWLLPWTARLCACCYPGRLCSVLAGCCPGWLCSVLACWLLLWTALLCANL